MKKTKLTIIFFNIFTLMILICGSTVYSYDTSGSNEWEFNLAPFYLWAVSMEGDLDIGTNTIPVNVEFNDIFDNLETAFIVHFEGMHKNKWGFLVDINYLDISSDQPTLGPDLKVDFTPTLGELAGLYRLDHQDYKIDVIFGLRYTELESKVALVGGPTLVDGSKDWVDPIIGLRWLWGFADRWSLLLRGDIGGFGVGSDFAWQAAGLIDWQPFKYVSFIGGYRALYQNFEEGSGSSLFKYDATMQGPLLGVNFVW